jgi:hypothetical protein
VFFPFVRLCGSHGESDVRWTRAIVRGKDSSGQRGWMQRRPFFEEEKNLVICHLKGTEAILVLKDDGKAEDPAVPFRRPVYICHIETRFDDSAGDWRHGAIFL